MAFRSSGKLAWLLAALCAASLSGCKSDDLTRAAGPYEGFMVSGTQASPTQSSISATVETVSANELRLSIQTEPASSQLEFDLLVSPNGSNEEIQLSSSQGLLSSAAATVTFGPDANQAHCYAGIPSTSGAELCFDGTELSIVLPAALTTASVGNIKIVLDQLDPSAAPSSLPSPLLSGEAPRPYTIEQLIQRSMTRSFPSEAQFESVVQAKLTAQNAYLNLLPHINLGSGLDLDGFVATTMVRAIGDLLPFFLPNRWFQAAALQDQNNAEFDSYRVVQAGAMNMVQGLALSVLRDEQALLTMEQSRVQITEIRDEVLAAEQSGSGTVQVGTSDELTSVLQALMSSIDSMNETILEEKRSLSQAAGFTQPDAVSEVDPVTVPAITGPIPGSQADFESSAANRSLNLLQLDDLIQSEQETQKASAFQWLDPSGADQGSLGFGLVDYVEISGAAIQQIYDNKAQVLSQLLGQVDNVLSESQQISDQYRLDVQSSQTYENTIDRLLLDFRTGAQFQISDLVTALTGKAQSDANVVNAQYAYLTLQAQMDFLTYSADYAALLTEKEQCARSS